jgi:hypothetical protein
LDPDDTVNALDTKFGVVLRTRQDVALGHAQLLAHRFLGDAAETIEIDYADTGLKVVQSRRLLLPPARPCHADEAHGKGDENTRSAAGTRQRARTEAGESIVH